MKITRKTYCYTYPDGTSSEATVLCCPCEGCPEEFEALPMLAQHALVHGLQIAVPEATQKVTRLKLPDGSVLLVCPVCQGRFPQDEALFLEHLASVHGRALAAPGRSFGGESEQLDLLHHRAVEGHYQRRAEAQRLQLVSLGSFCGMKFSIQRLGLGDAHLPFDWIRTTSLGLEGFLLNGFKEFFVGKRYDLKEMTVHRAEQHSFWHDDISKAEVREKLMRRVSRFTQLAEKATAEARDLLFIRSCTCTEELRRAEALYAALHGRFSLGPGRRLLLAIVVDGQGQHEGPIHHARLPGLAFFLQPVCGQEDSSSGQAFSWAVAAACDAALDGGLGFAITEEDRIVQSAADLLDGGSWQGRDFPPLSFSDAGLRSGFGGFACFEPPKQLLEQNT